MLSTPRRGRTSSRAGSRLLGAVSRERWVNRPPMTPSSRSSRPRARSRRLFSPSRAGTPIAPSADARAPSPTSLARVRDHLGAAAVLRAASASWRRPPQGVLGPRHPAHRCRSALSARLLPSSRSRARVAAGDLPRPGPRRTSADDAARGRRLAGPWSPDPTPTGRGVARIWVARSAGSRCCCSTPTWRRTRRTCEVTDRLYGTSEHRLRQELLLGVGGVRCPCVVGDHWRA